MDSELHQARVTHEKSHHQPSRNCEQKEPSKRLECDSGQQDEKNRDGGNRIGKLLRPRDPYSECERETARSAERSRFCPEGEFGPGHEKDGHLGPKESSEWPKSIHCTGRPS